MQIRLTPVSPGCRFVLLVHGKEPSPDSVSVKWPVFSGRGRVTEITSGTGRPFVHPGKSGPFRTWTSQSSNLSIVVFTPETKTRMVKNLFQKLLHSGQKCHKKRFVINIVFSNSKKSNYSISKKSCKYLQELAWELHSCFSPILTFHTDPSQDSSIGSISAWYWGGPGFKSPKGREFFSENKITPILQR